MLFKNCKKSFLLLAETTGAILQTTLRSYLRILHRKNVSLNPKVSLYNTTFSGKICYIAGLSL